MKPGEKKNLFKATQYRFVSEAGLELRLLKIHHTAIYAVTSPNSSLSAQSPTEMHLREAPSRLGGVELL